MWIQFFSQNAYFAILLLATLVSAAVSWLYLDAWTNQKSHKELLKWLGFAALSVSFLLQSTLIEQDVLGKSILGEYGIVAFGWLRLIGYVLIIAGNIIDPLQKAPKVEELTPETFDLEPLGDDQKKKKAKSAKAIGLGAVTATTKWLLPIGAWAIAGLYWHRVTKGYERHLRPLVYGFGLLGLSEFLYTSRFLRGTTDPVFYRLVAPYGLVWWLQYLVLLAAMILIGVWVWGYLVKRVFGQLFMVFMITTAAVFLIVSVSFTALLLQNIRNSTLHNLHTAAKVLDYALDAKKSETAASAEQLAGDGNVANAIVQKDRAYLADKVTTHLISKKETDVIIVNANGQVLVRAKDTDAWGDSLSADPFIKSALSGANHSGTVVREGVQGRVVGVQSARAVKGSGGSIVGAVVSVVELGPSFVDGLKGSTGLDSSIYAGNELVATTFVGPDGKTRSVGTKITNSKVNQKVLQAGQSYESSVSIQNRSTLGAFLPIKDSDGKVLGAVLVAEPESAVLKTAGHSVEITFLLTALLLVLSILPLSWIANMLTRQLS